MTDAPERIWVSTAWAHTFTEPDERVNANPYILATPEPLASSPEGQALIAEARREERDQLLLLEALRNAVAAGPMLGEDMRRWIDCQMIAARALKEETP